jgi:hypothetical protein
MRRVPLYLIALALSFLTLPDRAGWADEPNRLVPGGLLKPHPVPTVDPVPALPEPAVPRQSSRKAPPRRIHRTSRPHEQPSAPTAPPSDGSIQF